MWPRLALISVALLFVACSTEGLPEPAEAGVESQSEALSPDSSVASSLFVSSKAYDFAQNPRLLERIMDGPHGYFRFISEVFSRVACERLGARWSSVPMVNLHGDAHLEQYAITSNGRGLADFDRSTRGMAFLDHVSFGVSVHLACLSNGWTGKEAAAMQEFFRGYYAALEDSQMHPAPPAIVERIRATFTGDHARLLANAEGFMRPMERPRAEIEKAMRQYARQMHELSPELPPSFFRISKVGELHLGIGSALDEKYLMRIEGATGAAEDDLILEAKEIRELEELACIEDAGAEPERILTGHNRISYTPYRFVGFLEMDSRPGTSQSKLFWVFAWDDDYEELSIKDSFQSLDDLKSIAYDVGVQLGLGHPRGIGYPDSRKLPRALASYTKQLEQDLQLVMDDLASRTIRAWQEFCAEVESDNVNENKQIGE